MPSPNYRQKNKSKSYFNSSVGVWCICVTKILHLCLIQEIIAQLKPTIIILSCSPLGKVQTLPAHARQTQLNFSLKWQGIFFLPCYKIWKLSAAVSTWIYGNEYVTLTFLWWFYCLRSNLKMIFNQSFGRIFSFQKQSRETSTFLYYFLMKMHLLFSWIFYQWHWHVIM